MPRNPWNVRAEGGPGRALDPARPWYAYALAAVREAVPEPARGARALDLGCGMGEFSLMLKGLGYAVEGLDGNEAQVQAVRARGLDAGVADLEGPLPYPDGAFDLVACLELIEHLALAEDLLKEARRVLKPGGMAVVSTPNFSFVNNRLHYLLGRPPLNEGVHVRFFTKRTLEAALARAGLRVVARASYGVVPLLSTATTRLLGKGPVLCPVPGPLEGLLAYGLIYLAAAPAS